MFPGGFLVVTWGLLFVAAEEPHCSKYDFEEKVLEKLVRMEFQTERIKMNFDDSLKEMVTIKDDLKATVEDASGAKADMAKDINAKLAIFEEQIIKALEDKIEEFRLLSERVIIPHIVFRAMLGSSHLTVSVGQTLVFPTVLSNEGGGYDPSTGTFTAPVNGTYIFSVTLCPVHGKALTYNVTVDGAVNNTVHLYGDFGHSCHSSNTYLNLSDKQTVGIKISYIHPSSAYSIDCDISHRWNMFSGILISIL